MSYINTGLSGYCEAVLKGMEVYGCAGTKHTPVGTLQSLFDISNTSGVTFQTIIDERRNKPSVRVRYLQRPTENDAVDYSSCDNTMAEFGYIDKPYTMTMSASVNVPISYNTMLNYCDESTKVINGLPGTSTGVFYEHLNFLYALQDALRQKINKAVIAKMAANVGINKRSGDNLPQSLCFINALDGSKKEIGISELIHDMAKNEVNCTPIIVGFGNFDKFNSSMGVGCCNANGLDWNAMNNTANYKFYKDIKLPSELAAPNDFFIFEPGSVQFLYYNSTKPFLQSGYPNSGDTIYGLIPDDLVPGLKYNLKIERVNCKDVNGRAEINISWNLALWVDFDIVFLPTDRYKDGDNLYTNNGIVNGLFRYTATSC